MNIDIDLNNKILIIPNNIKTKVVKNINNLPKLSNVKILTDQQFITNLTIDYNEKAIIYLMIIKMTYIMDTLKEKEKKLLTLFQQDQAHQSIKLDLHLI